MNFLRRFLGLDTDQNEQQTIPAKSSANSERLETAIDESDAEKIVATATDSDTREDDEPLEPVGTIANPSTEKPEEVAEVSEPVADDEIPLETTPIRYIPDGVTRPLPAEPFGLPQTSVGHIVFGQTSDQGMVRTNNQDAALSFFMTSDSVDQRPDFGLFIVADGMGGHHDGEKASALTSRVVAAQIISKIYLPMLTDYEDQDSERPTIAETLIQSVQEANQKVLALVPDAGTTLTAMVMLGNLAHIAHVGDSRAYIINKDGIEQITRDHSLVQRLIELDQLTPEEAANHNQKNVLYRAVGQNAELEVDTMTRRLPAGSWVLICSDGLWGAVREEDVLDIVRQSNDPQDACDKLIALANKNGGADNITAVLLKTPGF